MGASPDMRILNGGEWSHFPVQDLSRIFGPFCPRLHLLFAILAPDGVKVACQICLKGNGETRSFPFISRLRSSLSVLVRGLGPSFLSRVLHAMCPSSGIALSQEATT